MKVSQLFIYPIKSLGGFSVDEMFIQDHGPDFDRQWMLVDNSGKFLTQRQIPELALFKVKFLNPVDSLRSFIVISSTGAEVEIPVEPEGEALAVQVWEDQTEAREVGANISEWFSQLLNRKVFLVKSEKLRSTKSKYGEVASFRFADGFPFLMLSQASLDELNQRLEMKGGSALDFDRFRPNVVIDGGGPGCEDRLRQFQIGEVSFSAVKPCTRCIITCTDQGTAEVGKEPLKTLSEYRRDGRRIHFGQNLNHFGTGVIRIGDELTI